MAEKTNSGASAAKRKPAPKRKPTPKRKTVAARKPAAKHVAPRKSTPDFAANAQETGRNVLLAGLGFYGKAYDQAQEQFDALQKRIKARRANADKVYKELVKRGKKVEKDAKVALGDLELPKLELDSLADRKKLEQQLKKARARFNELKESVRMKSAA